MSVDKTEVRAPVVVVKSASGIILRNDIVVIANVTISAASALEVSAITAL
ncbi:hypothetical protein SDC9_137247 [bioreactor metagenome]|uniref:Uncharacterized protein n=1 Tax=bioreactor metagenome TaxID=1076179 RepID=A0A645DL08_9ZZZZ